MSKIKPIGNSREEDEQNELNDKESSPEEAEREVQQIHKRSELAQKSSNVEKEKKQAEMIKNNLDMFGSIAKA